MVELLDELASDPDDKHVPPSVRNSYRCEKVFIKIMGMVMEVDNWTWPRSWKMNIF